MTNDKDIPVLEQLISQGHQNQSQKDLLELQIKEILERHTQQALTEILSIIAKK